MADVARTGEVVWYVTGRFYESEGSPTTLLDVGYFLNLQGVTSETLSLLTFAAQPFQSPTIDNGGLQISLDLQGTFGIYLHTSVDWTFDDPGTFTTPSCVATFSRVSIVPTTKISGSGLTIMSNVFTAQLTSSTPFQLDGQTYDFAELVGFGVTQWGTAAVEPLAPPSGYSAVVPFVGSAIRVG